jgi:hypothetical protein
MTTSLEVVAVSALVGQILAQRAHAVQVAGSMLTVPTGAEPIEAAAVLVLRIDARYSMTCRSMLGPNIGPSAESAGRGVNEATVTGPTRSRSRPSASRIVLVSVRVEAIR